MNKSLPFNVYLNGQRFGGWWEIDGKDVLVSSAYGSRRAPKGRGDPEKVAQRLLEAIVTGQLTPSAPSAATAPRSGSRSRRSA